uniref:Uncharacterized protein n=1 Tax=Arundo donax TaxID=35708 RepID=A0A0A9GJB9_ARUDO
MRYCKSSDLLSLVPYLQRDWIMGSSILSVIWVVTLELLSFGFFWKTINNVHLKDRFLCFLDHVLVSTCAIQGYRVCF